MDAKKEVNGLGIDGNDRLPELHESTEPESNKRNGRYNLRKSLAWDSAFFTNAGNLSNFLHVNSKSIKFTFLEPDRTFFLYFQEC